MKTTALLALLALFPVAGAVSAAEQVCDRSGSISTPSPDGKWIANVQEEVCSTATGAAAGITVIIVSSNDPQHAKRVFFMPVPRSREDWPRIRWDSPAAMEVRVANLSEASPPQAEYEGIRIVLAYCNDNADDRARLVAYKAAVKQWQADVSAWAKLRKQDAAAAGTIPPRPEEPRLSPGRCTE
jgi:hypothetical protein